MRLEDDGLVLREWGAADLDSMVELLDEPVIAYRTPLPSPFTRAEAQRRLDRAPQRWRPATRVTVNGERPVGVVMVSPEAHLAYAVGRQHRGQGLAVRALRMAAEYVVALLATPVLWLEIEPDNDASVAVARRAGFRLSDEAEETVEDKGRADTLQLWERVADATD